MLSTEVNLHDGQWLSFIAGEPGTGKSHLLFALCHTAYQQNLTHAYVDLTTVADLSIEMLAGLEQMAVLCIDNVHHLSGKTEWQQALFDLINRVKEQGRCRLVVSSALPHQSLNFALKDLSSRLLWGLSFNLRALSDKEREAALIIKAKAIGINLQVSTARFLVNHWQQDMGRLMQAMQELAEKSLQQQRKLTIPFIKLALNI